MSDGQTEFRVTLPAGWDAAGDARDVRKHRNQTNEVTFGIYTPDLNVWPDACGTRTRLRRSDRRWTT